MKITKGKLFAFLLLFLLVLATGIAYFTGFINPKLKYSQTKAFPRLGIFDRPVNLIQAEDGSNNLFIVEQKGYVKFFEKETQVTSTTTFLDITDRVFYDWEGGLIGFAFNPDFINNGLFYVFYTTLDLTRNETSGCDPCLTSIISQFSTFPNDLTKGDPNSEVILLKIEISTKFHRGGQMNFGPDGMFYVNIGEDLRGGQDLSTLYGTILRIDVDKRDIGLNYSIPIDNPFFNSSNNETRTEIYAYGFRNPWRSSFDVQTNTFWVGDVGTDTYEEINLVNAGGNYGWEIKEGIICTPPTTSCNETGLIEPLIAYPHNATADINDPTGLAVIGGYVYRGEDFGELKGKYVFADYMGRTYSVDYDFSQQSIKQIEFITRIPDSISGVGLGQDGEIYFIGHLSGDIYRLNTFIATIGIYALTVIIYFGALYLIVKAISFLIGKYTDKSVSKKQQWIIIGFVTVIVITILVSIFVGRALQYIEDAN